MDTIDGKQPAANLVGGMRAEGCKKYSELSKHMYSLLTLNSTQHAVCTEISLHHSDYKTIGTQHSDGQEVNGWKSLGRPGQESICSLSNQTSGQGCVDT